MARGDGLGRAWGGVRARCSWGCRGTGRGGASGGAGVVVTVGEGCSDALLDWRLFDDVARGRRRPGCGWHHHPGANTHRYPSATLLQHASSPSRALLLLQHPSLEQSLLPAAPPRAPSRRVYPQPELFLPGTLCSPARSSSSCTATSRYRPRPRPRPRRRCRHGRLAAAADHRHHLLHEEADPAPRRLYAPPAAHAAPSLTDRLSIRRRRHSARLRQPETEPQAQGPVLALRQHGRRLGPPPLQEGTTLTNICARVHANTLPQENRACRLSQVHPAAEPSQVRLRRRSCRACRRGRR